MASLDAQYASRLITYSILQDAQNPGLIYLGTNLGVYRSMDRGVSWRPCGLRIASAETKTAPARRRGKAPARRALLRTCGRIFACQRVCARAQIALNAAGYLIGTSRWPHGHTDHRAVRRFQSDRSLPVTELLTTNFVSSLCCRMRTQGLRQARLHYWC